MDGNPLKDRLARREPLFGGWCSTGTPFVAEVIALQGYDFIGLDAQHGLWSYDRLLSSMMALARTGAGIIVRMPSRDAAAAGRMLDAGAHGVIFPMVETADDAREAVEACRIHPNGRRSFGPVRASQSFGRDPIVVSEGVSCIVMIETALGVENIEAIAAVPGIDCIYIGPGDLAITYGLPPGNDPIPGPHADGIERVRKVAAARGIAVGMPCTTAASAMALAERGFSFLAVGADTWWLTERARAEAESLRAAGHLGS
ncbi:4-hydroxy-2-oxoheptanedioate aldolase [Nocardia sp. GAS34]|uniref:HpcH/HpaI aldolase family protein n=1 Tax=unclassified Nocardia TaxID=2637762 RepID=UPI003D24229F